MIKSLLKARTNNIWIQLFRYTFVGGIAFVLDGTLIRMPKTYPAYFGSYDRFS